MDIFAKTLRPDISFIPKQSQDVSALQFLPCFAPFGMLSSTL